MSCCHPAGFSAHDLFVWKSCEIGVKNRETTRRLDDSTTWHWPRSHFHHWHSYHSMLSLPLELQWEVRRGSSHSHFPSQPRFWRDRADSPQAYLTNASHCRNCEGFTFMSLTSLPDQLESAVMQIRLRFLLTRCGCCAELCYTGPSGCIKYLCKIHHVPKGRLTND